MPTVSCINNNRRRRRASLAFRIKREYDVNVYVHELADYRHECTRTHTHDTVLSLLFTVRNVMVIRRRAKIKTFYETRNSYTDVTPYVVFITDSAPVITYTGNIPTGNYRCFAYCTHPFRGRTGKSKGNVILHALSSHAAAEAKTTRVNMIPCEHDKSIKRSANILVYSRYVSLLLRNRVSRPFDAQLKR